MKTKLTLLLCLFVFSLSFGQIDLESDLIAHYKFNESDYVDGKILDETSNHYDLSAFNIITFDNDRFGEYPGATMLGYDAYATLNETESYYDFQQLTQFTFAFHNLLLPDLANLENGDYPLLSIEDAADRKLTLIFKRSGAAAFYTLKYTDGSALLFKREVPIVLNTNFIWSHIAFTFDAVNEQAEFYVNGVLEHTVYIPLATFHDAAIYFGKNSDNESGESCFDDFYIYKRLLNTEEVAELNGLAPTAVLDIESNENISIYPIPSKDKNIHIEVSGYQESFDVRVYDQLGRMVEQSNLSSGDKVDLTALNAGVYYLNLHLTDAIHTKKLVLLE